MSWQLIPAHESGEWDNAIARCGDHDVYHLAAYHRIPTPLANGAGWLFSLEHKGSHTAVPFLIRPIGDGQEVDAVSAYGYPGIISSYVPNSDLVDEFGASLRRAFSELDVVSWFGRQHPLFPTDQLLKGAAEVVDLGPTVTIDLSPPEKDLRALANDNHRRNLEKASALGILISEDPLLAKREMFKELYDATMARVGATDEYLFPLSYYNTLQQELGKRVTMFLAEIDGRTASAVIVFQHKGIIQYHLGGTHEDFISAGTTRYLLEHVRRRAKENGDRWFHLGGGIGAKEDSLLRFKAGFAKTFRRYRIIKWIQNKDRYRALVNDHVANGLEATTGFFPAYRW